MAYRTLFVIVLPSEHVIICCVDEMLRNKRRKKDGSIPHL